jgi:hypothetical protein
MQMKKYFVEIVVGIVMVLVFLGVSAWQSSETLSTPGKLALNGG